MVCKMIKYWNLQGGNSSCMIIACTTALIAYSKRILRTVISYTAYCTLLLHKICTAQLATGGSSLNEVTLIYHKPTASISLIIA